MRLMVFSALAIVLASCSDPAAEALRRVEIAKRGGDEQEACRQMRVVQAERLKQEREREYQEAKLSADVYCQNLELRRRL